ncbi:MAG: hypothetical protein WC881_03350 [Elusimicrobiota bacterium]|jgi:hypothetical protein
MNPTSDAWYHELALKFQDGSREMFFLDMSRSGRHMPRQARQPADWTRLAFHKCPCCPLSQESYCPAALSLEETILKLSRRTSTEPVAATAVDSENRRTIVTWPLQQIGAVFVQIAVFSSGCPVGSRFRPMLRDVRPFSTSRELGKHLVFKYLVQHKSDPQASEQAVLSELEPLREVFAYLFMRLETVSRDSAKDAIPNSIAHMHAMTLYLGAKAKELVQEILQEMR